MRAVHEPDCLPAIGEIREAWVKWRAFGVSQGGYAAEKHVLWITYPKGEEMDKLKSLWGQYGTPQNLKVLYILLSLAALAAAAGAPGAGSGGGGAFR